MAENETTDLKEEKVTFVHHERKGFVWPLILIFVGSIFLLNNLEILPWGIWDNLWKFWPIILVLIGFNMIFGESGLGSFIVGIFFAIVALLIVAMVVSIYNPGFNSWMRAYFPNWRYFENMVPQSQNILRRQMPMYRYR